MERLQKVIANSGYCSRRKAEELITSGKVSINGNIETELGTKVTELDEIRIDGKKITSERKEYYLLNKPRNIICSTNDEKDREVITDLIDTKARIYPVGRLDYDTTGIILLTNDGELANILMHPSNEVEKRYLAKLNGIFDMENYFKLKKGIVIDDIKCTPTRLKIKKTDSKTNTSLIEISLIEGRNHIVKNIFSFLGFEVLKLTRETYGFLSLGNLKSGEYRKLSETEIKELYKYKKKRKN